MWVKVTCCLLLTIFAAYSRGRSLLHPAQGAGRCGRGGHKDWRRMMLGPPKWLAVEWSRVLDYGKGQGEAGGGSAGIGVGMSLISESWGGGMVGL